MKTRKPKFADQPRFDIDALRALRACKRSHAARTISPRCPAIGNTDYQPKGGVFRVSRPRIVRHS